MTAPTEGRLATEIARARERANWLFDELDDAAREFREMPDEYKPIVTAPNVLIAGRGADA